LPSVSVVAQVGQACFLAGHGNAFGLALQHLNLQQLGDDPFSY
jgi:hypothetical protein